MVTLEQAKKGLRAYIEKELVERVDGLKKWMLFASIDPLVMEMERLFMDNKEVLMRSGYMSEDNRIDDDRIFDALIRIAQKTGPVIDHMPFLGDVMFCDEDIRQLHKYVG